MADIYSLLAGNLADRPAPIEENRGYYAWDTGVVYVVRSGVWVLATDLGEINRYLKALKDAGTR